MNPWTKKIYWLVVAITLLNTALFTGKAEAQDLFSTPAPTPPIDNQSTPYTTSAAFFADTKNGKIPEQLSNNSADPRCYLMDQPLGRSILAIIEKESSVKWNDIGQDKAGTCGEILQYLSNYEMTNHDPGAAQRFKDYRKRLDAPQDFKLAFDNFLKEYAGITQAYLDAKQHAIAARQHEANAEEQAQEDVANAQAAAEKEATDMQEEVADKARAAVREARQKKLDAILASPAYQIYLSALKIEEGEKLINKAQTALNYDDKVTANSGVSDLALRRSAGEEMEAGKKIVDDEFPSYQKLGGTATTPADVHAGPDPGADYR